MWTNLVIMIGLLVGPSIVSRIVSPTWPHAAASGACLCFLFTASGHFLFDNEMVAMLPAMLPFRLELVWATGLVEIAIAVGLAVPRTRRISAWAAIAVLILFFPANIYAAFVQAPIGGHALGPAYLLVRAPVQMVLIGWIYLGLIKPGAASSSPAVGGDSLVGQPQPRGRRA